MNKRLRCLLVMGLVTGSTLCHDSVQQVAADTPVSESTNVTASNQMTDNPLLKPSSLPFAAPDFGAVRFEHFKPAFEAGMAEQLREIQAIADNPAAPSFDNVLVAMERTGQILDRTLSIFYHLAGADTTEAIQKLDEEMSPRLAAHQDDIYLNRQLFTKLQTLWDQRDKLALNEEQSRLLKETYESFIRAGAKLNDSEQSRIRQINGRLSSLATQFQNNLLSITKERSVVIDNAADLAGMSAADIDAAKEAAVARGLTDKYLLVITNTTRQPILTSLQNREVRKRVWQASSDRGQGQDGGIDNRPLVLELAKLRAEKAAILGFSSYAAFAMANQMAEKPEAGIKMLRDLVPQVLVKAKSEAAKIEQLMQADGVQDTVQPWDWEYYAEKVRQQQYQVDENLVKPYFELESVLHNGVFFTMKQLYGIEFRERTDLPVYHPTVRVFDVLDRDGSQLGLFYADYFQRDSKRGGAWMDALNSQSRLMNQAPVIVNVMNIPRPAEGQPALISFDNVTTMFHEMGHAVHGLFSSVTYPTLSGTNVPRDYVEFPSTFHEDWAIDPKVLGNFAKHYETKQTIPRDLLDKTIAASKFNQGFDTLEYLSAALLDLAWHQLSLEDANRLLAQSPNAVNEFENQALADFEVNYGPVPPRYRTTFFAHVWSGGYASSYYAYLWSEVLAADAFEHMRKQGGLTSANGQSYRDLILSRGGTREVMQQYIDFAGAEPKVDALLKRRGLKD